ncbi:hypothetical protein [Ensifer canadensis]|uniref:hypothetical protein n=1 Tax=Ensifer canadensis TaxID=555315 RepID=UPI0035E3EF51
MAEFWPGGSKLPAVTQLLTLTLERKRGQFCALIVEVVKQSMTWRGKREPLTRAEVEQLNALLPSVGFKIAQLLDEGFLATLAGSPAAAAPASPAPSTAVTPEPAALAALANRLLDLSGLAPQARGFAFEGFLTDLFQTYGLAPRGSFRPREGEQIDGSFELDIPTWLKRNGRTSRPRRRISTSSPVSWRAGRPGRAACSSATAGSPCRGWMRSIRDARASFAWTASTCIKP